VGNDIGRQPKSKGVKLQLHQKERYIGKGHPETIPEGTVEEDRFLNVGSGRSLEGLTTENGRSDELKGN